MSGGLDWAVDGQFFGKAPFQQRLKSWKGRGFTFGSNPKTVE